MATIALATLMSRYVTTGALLATGTVALLLLAAPAAELVGAQGAASEILRLLDARSPGERSNAQLAKGKPKKTAADGRKDVSEQALGKVFPPRESVTDTPEELLAKFVPAGVPSIAVPLEIPSVGLTDVAPPGDLPITGLPALIGGGGGSGGLPFVGGGLSVGGGGDGDGGTSGGGTPPVTTTPVTSAVPEPATWMMMILGFFACGWTMRRKERKERKVQLPVSGACEPGC
jgi:hypothetical protein